MERFDMSEYGILQRNKYGKTIDQENKKFNRKSPYRESLNFNKRGNGCNFLDVFKVLSKYDLTLQEYLQRINTKQLNQNYLSHPKLYKALKK